MAISLQSLSKPQHRPFHMTLVGEGGVGKTTLAALMPSPVIIRTEDGSASIVGQDIAMFPVAQTADDVFEAIKSLATEDHKFQTLVIDSITQLNILIESEIVAGDPKAKSINTAMGGYGAGHNAASEIHRKVRHWCSMLTEAKNMNVVYIAHAETEQVDLPDTDPYSRYTIRMHKKSVSHYSDNVDLIGYIKLKTFVTGQGDKKKATSDGSRIITCYPVPSHISKNRYGITSDLDYIEGQNPFVDYIPNLKPTKLKEVKNG